MLLAIVPLLAAIPSRAPVPMLVALTTGSTEHASGELVSIDARSGAAKMLGAIEGRGGAEVPTDLAFSPDGKTLYVAQTVFPKPPSQDGPIGDRVTGVVTSVIQVVDPTTRKVRNVVSPSETGVLDALVFDAQGRMLATFLPGGRAPQELVRVDLASGALTFVGRMEHTFVRSLAFVPGTQRLVGLQTRRPPDLADALVGVDPATGAVTVITELKASEAAHAMTILPDGRILVLAGDTPGMLHLLEVDPATGSVKTIADVDRNVAGLSLAPASRGS